MVLRSGDSAITCSRRSSARPDSLQRRPPPCFADLSETPVLWVATLRCRDKQSKPSRPGTSARPKSPGIKGPPTPGRTNVRVLRRWASRSSASTTRTGRSPNTSPRSSGPPRCWPKLSSPGPTAATPVASVTPPEATSDAKKWTPRPGCDRGALEAGLERATAPEPLRAAQDPGVVLPAGPLKRPSRP